MLLTFPSKVFWNWHFACELEVLQRHLDDGGKVVACIMNWHDVAYDMRISRVFEKDPKPDNAWKAYWKEKWYLSKIKNGYGRLSEMPEIHYLPPINVPSEYTEWVDNLIASNPPLKELTLSEYEGVPVGAAAVSSFVSLYRKINIEVADHAEALRQYFRCAYTTYLASIEQIQLHQPDTVLLFNGRLATNRGTYEACQQTGTTSYIHERGAYNHRFEIFVNGMIHGRAHFLKRMHEWAEGKPQEEIAELGHKFYQERSQGVQQVWLVFTEKQKHGAMPTNWNDSDTNIAVFNTSEDEFYSVAPDWINPYYSSQIVGIRDILSKADPSYKFWIRIHPNLGEVSPDEIQAWFDLATQFSNVTVIAPESEISTYALLEQCDKALTFGSTVGAEATYARKPSILAGVSFYKGADIAYEPTDKDDILRLLHQEDLPPKDLAPALLYGAYTIGYGTEQKYMEATSLRHAKYRGKDVRANPLYSFLAWGGRNTLERLGILKSEEEKRSAQ